MTRISSIALVISLLWGVADSGLAEEPSTDVYDRIKNELASGSMIAENLRQLSDVYGPRLTGTSDRPEEEERDGPDEYAGVL